MRPTHSPTAPCTSFPLAFRASSPLIIRASKTPSPYASHRPSSLASCGTFGPISKRKTSSCQVVSALLTRGPQFYAIPCPLLENSCDELQEPAQAIYLFCPRDLFLSLCSKRARGSQAARPACPHPPLQAPCLRHRPLRSLRRRSRRQSPFPCRRKHAPGPRHELENRNQHPSDAQHRNSSRYRLPRNRQQNLCHRRRRGCAQDFRRQNLPPHQIGKTPG